jgi:hypothetical protein
VGGRAVNVDRCVRCRRVELPHSPCDVEGCGCECGGSGQTALRFGVGVKEAVGADRDAGP